MEQGEVSPDMSMIWGGGSQFVNSKGTACTEGGRAGRRGSGCGPPAARVSAGVAHVMSSKEEKQRLSGQGSASRGARQRASEATLASKPGDAALPPQPESDSFKEELGGYTLGRSSEAECVSSKRV